MSLFKESIANKELDDTSTLVNDFVRQKPYGTYRPVNYQISERFVDLKNEIDKYLERMFEGKIDDANGDVMDNLIYDNTRIALQDIEMQKVQHDDTIRNFIIQAEGARTAFAEHKQTVESMISEVQSRLNVIRTKYLQDEFGGK